MDIYKINSPISTTPYGRFSHYYTGTIDLDNQLDLNYDKVNLNVLDLKVSITTKLNMFTNDFQLYFYFKYNSESIFITSDLIPYLLNRMPKENITLFDDQIIKQYKENLPLTKDLLFTTYNLIID